MSFQAYLDSVKAQTGKTPEDFKKLAQEKGLIKHGEIVAWLKADYGLGHGHANAVTQVILKSDLPKPSLEDSIAKHFVGAKASWRKPYDEFLAKVEDFGPDVTVAPTNSYISILRRAKKFAVVQVTSERLDVGIKLKGTPPEGRFVEAGTWNAMVTHRVQITDPNQIDAELITWLHRAYAKAR